MFASANRSNRRRRRTAAVLRTGVSVWPVGRVPKLVWPDQTPPPPPPPAPVSRVCPARRRRGRRRRERRRTGFVTYFGLRAVRPAAFSLFYCFASNSVAFSVDRPNLPRTVRPVRSVTFRFRYFYYFMLLSLTRGLPSQGSSFVCPRRVFRLPIPTRHGERRNCSRVGTGRRET